MLEGLVGAALLVWLLLSVLNQFSVTAWKEVVARHDLCMLLPVWTFFAPNPGSKDYRLLIRGYEADDQLPSTWKEIPLVRKRTLRDCLFNSEKRFLKGLFDLVQSLVTVRQSHRDLTAVVTSLPYVAILNFVAGLEKPETVRYIQFIIVQTDGFFAECGPEVLLRSRVHSVCE
jgi:hypothetical protein